MKKIIAICGKICSGKSYYANKIKEKEKAVILSCDEVTKMLFNNNLGEKHDEMTKRIINYLLKKSVDIASTNTTVILDWGFWSKQDRIIVREYYISHNIPIELHYINIDDKSWKKNIEERNKCILQGNSENNYYLDEGLMAKLLNKWEEPNINEIDICYNLTR